MTSVLRPVLQLQRLLQALRGPAASITAAEAAAEINERWSGDPPAQIFPANHL